jgi:type III secretion protein W
MPSKTKWLADMADISIGGIPQIDPFIRLADMATTEKPPRLTMVNQASLIAETQGLLSEALAGMLKGQSRSNRAGMAGTQVEADAEAAADTRQALKPNRKRDIRKLAAEIADGKTDWKSALRWMQSRFPSPREQAEALAELRRDVLLGGAMHEDLRTDIEHAIAALQRQLHQARQTQLGPLLRLFRRRDHLSGRKLLRLYRMLLAAGTSPRTTYRHLIEAFGFAMRGKVIELLERAAVADIGGDLRDTPDDAYRPMLDLLLQLRLLRCADALLLSAVNRPGRHKEQKDGDREPEDQALIVLLLASLDDENEAAELFASYLDRMLAGATWADVQLWSRRVLRGLDCTPLELYPDLAYRSNLLALLIKTTDHKLGDPLMQRSANPKGGRYV